MNWHRIDQNLDAGEDGDEGKAPSGDIKASGAVAGEIIPMRAPADLATFVFPKGQMGKPCVRRRPF
jgi:hypothetical protein